MKLKIKVRKINKSLDLPKIIDKGDWIDLRASETVVMNAPQSGTLKKHKVNGKTVSHRDVTFDAILIPLGIAMQLPKGLEAVVLPRSGTFKNYGITLANSEGVIDNTYCGNNDEWKFNAIAFRDTKIEANDRICQFRVQLSQKATLWQRLKWVLCSGIKIEEVDQLSNVNRGGFTSTGVK